MKRIEIIVNKSIEEDMFDLFKKKGVAEHYTKIPVAYGVGNKGPRMGDHIWPEENSIIIIYCENEEAVKIQQAIMELKEFFTKEGLKIFEMDVK